MNLRDYFAGQALGGFVLEDDVLEQREDARLAYDYADAMMEERGKRLAAKCALTDEEIDAWMWEDEVNEHATETEENYG